MWKREERQVSGRAEAVTILSLCVLKQHWVPEFSPCRKKKKIECVSLMRGFAKLQTKVGFRVPHHFSSESLLSW